MAQKADRQGQDMKYSDHRDKLFREDDQLVIEYLKVALEEDGTAGLNDALLIVTRARGLV